MIKELTEKLTANISRAVCGKNEQIKLVCAAMLAGGHVLLEDVPGTGKTLLARSLAKSVDGDFRRIQFTPDLLPSDITGINFYNTKEQEFVLRRGPVFTNILLADEINRATPRTQSALLECMEERRVTIDGETMKLEAPFFVIATQNPAEIQGTYPLPEAQLDRFVIRLALGYPDREDEIRVIGGVASHQTESLGATPFGAAPVNAEELLSAVCTGADIVAAQSAVDACGAGEAVCGYIADIAAATRRHAGIKLGLSTRGAVALRRMSCAIAMIDGRGYAMPQDVRKAAPYVIPHRLIYKGYSSDGVEIVKQILESVPVPTENC